MSNLYMYNYNNYFNRIVKKETTLANYGTPIYSLVESDTVKVNFNPNDQLTTSHVVNYSGSDGDYLIITDSENKIISRWFITQNTKLRGGQHVLQLKRDVLVDFYDKIINAPALINRAMITEKNNPLLFNSEGFSFNQIKKSESLLKDKGLQPWYILYFAKNAPHKSGTIDIGVSGYDVEIPQAIENSVYQEGTFTKSTIKNFRITGLSNYNYFSIGETYFYMNILSNSSIRTDETYFWFKGDIIWFDDDFNTVKSTLEDAFLNKFSTLVTKADLTNNLTNQQKTALDNLGNGNSIIVKDGNGDLYRVTVNISTEQKDNIYVTTGDVADYMKSIITATGLDRTGNWGDKAFDYSYEELNYNVTVEAVTDTATTINWSLFDSGKATTNNCDYNIVAIPYGGDGDKIPDRQAVLKYYDPDEQEYFARTPFIRNSSLSLFVEKIIKEYGSTYLYDVQLLPYCPIPSIVNNPNGFIICYNDYESGTVGLDDSQYWNSDYDSDHAYDNLLAIYIKEPNFSFDISKSINPIAYTNKDYLNYKVSYESDIYRLVSPNFNGIFEFSPAKNNGVTKFNVDVTLRPYNPYIHINPDFKGLYGADFNDARGLICQGDFSLPIVTDPWKNYEYQNKNYQQIFNRQIEHMDFEFSKARTEALFGATVGTIGGGLAGGIGGAKVGGAIGGAIGGSVGTVASAIGGAIDYSILKERQAESKDLAIDNYKYNLGNIKALPYSINKVTPFTYNNKIWPFIETFSATEEERNILLNKIKYNSMNVNTIGTINQYLQADKTYISASIIRIEGLNEQTNVANEIYDQVMKGVYI